MRLPSQEIYESQQSTSLNADNEHDSQSDSNQRFILLTLSFSKAIEFFKKQSKIIYASIFAICMVLTVRNYFFFLKISVCPFSQYSQCYQQYFVPLGQKNTVWGPVIFTNFVSFTFFLHCMIKNKVNRIFSFLSLLMFIWLFILGDREMNVFNMIGIVKAAHLHLCIYTVFGYLIFLGLFQCYRRTQMFKQLFSIICLCILILAVVLDRTKQCSEWNEGINGQIQNEDGLCKMVIPNCYVLKLLSKIDYSYLYHDCFLGKGYQKQYNAYFSTDINNGTIIAFEDFVHFPDVKSSYSDIYQRIYQKAKRFKSLEEAKNDSKKYDVLFDTQQQRYHIQINRNEKLANVRGQKWRKYQKSDSPPLVKNVLVIFLDAVSRFQLRIKLPRLYQWLKERSIYYSYKKEQRVSLNQTTAQIYNFFRFLSLAPTTVENIFPMSYGHPHQQYFYRYLNDTRGMSAQPKDPTIRKMVHLINSYIERGYITGTAHSFCMPYLDFLFKQHSAIFKFPQFDHQTLSYNCDPNFISRDNTFDWLKGLNAVTDRCLYHKRIAEYNIEHAESFFEKYQKQAKFYMLNFIQGHAMIGGTVKYIDSDIVGFLNRLQSKGTLEDTAVILLSDHGQHIPAYKSVISDHFNPFLQVYLPKKLNTLYRDKIRQNQQNTISMYNIHYFLKHLAEGEQYQKKKFGLFGDLTSQKTCEDVLVYKQYSNQTYCYCK